MDKRLIVPERRVDPQQLSEEPYSPVQIKASTHRRLMMAKAEFHLKPAYELIEDALEMYYANTNVNNYHGEGVLVQFVDLQDYSDEDQE